MTAEAATETSSPLRPVPAFLVGVAAATAAEVSASLLLYSGPGLIRSLTTILAVEAAGFGLGLASAPRPHPRIVDSLRRRWLLCLVLFLGATLYSATWSLTEGVGQAALSQGLGLAFLGALPLYGCGLVLGTMSSVDEGARARLGSGAAAALGAAMGFVLTGLALPRILAPASLFLGSLVFLSAAGLFYGALLDRRLRVQVVERRSAGSVDARVEDRHDPRSGRTVRLLLEGDWIRRWMALEEGEGEHRRRPWDRMVWEAVQAGWDRGDDGTPRRILFVGGGASGVPYATVRSHPGVEVVVVERSETVVEMARDHLESHLDRDASERIRVRTGNVEDLLQDLGEPYDVVLVDLTAFYALGGLEALSRAGWDALTRAVAPDGVLASGPVAPPPGVWRMPTGWKEWSLALNPSAVQGVTKGRGDASEDLFVRTRGFIPVALLPSLGIPDEPLVAQVEPVP